MRRSPRARGRGQLTHNAVKRLNDPNIVDTGKQSAALSVTAPLKHWFDMRAVYPSPVSTIASVRDFITSVVVENNDADTNVDVDKACTVTGAATNSIKCSFTASGAAFDYENIPDGINRLYFVVGRAKFDGADPDPAGGQIAWANGGGLRARSGRVRFLDSGSDPDFREIATGRFCRGVKRKPDVDYVYAGVERAGDRVEHYSYHDTELVTRLVGINTIADAQAQNKIAEEHLNWNNGTWQQFWLSHGAAADNPDGINGQPFPNNDTDGCGELVQTSGTFEVSDYFGLMLYYFAELPPQHVIEAALEWCRIEWPLGNKVAPPHFIPYL